MTDFGESAVNGTAPRAQTLSQIHLRAERGKSRSIVVQHWAQGRWEAMPTWRFYRQVIRVGLYLRERLGLAQGDSAIMMSPLRPERLVAECAVVVQGAIAVAVDPDSSAAAIAAAVAQFSPKVAFVAGDSERARLLESKAGDAGVPRVVVFDPPAASAIDGTSPWSELLDLGGTLDTAERAQKFRAHARTVGADAPALAHAERADGKAGWKVLTHADVVRRVERFRSQVPSQNGDLAYVTAGELPVATLLALLAFVGDEHTTIAIGTSGKEVDEIAALRPHVLVAPSQVIERALASGPAPSNDGPALRDWLGRVPAFGPLKWWIRPATAGVERGERLRHAMTLEGTHLRSRNRTTGDAQ